MTTPTVSTARIQRLLGFSIGLVSISAEPVLSHPFIVCRLQRQMHTVAPLGSARKDPLRMLRCDRVLGHMDGVLDKYGLWALYQGFGTFITMNTLSTVAYLTVRGTLQGIFGDPLGTEDENDLERSYTNEGVPYAAVLSTLLQRSLSAMATLPFYAATIVCLVRDCTHSLPAPQHMSMWCTLFRQVPSAVVGNCRGVATVAVAVAGTGVGGRVGMIPLYRLALPFALTVLVNDTFEEFFTFASFTHLMGMVLGDSAETDKPSTGGSLNSTDGTGMRVGRTHNVTDPPITHLDNESWDDFSVTQAHSTLGERPHTPVNGFFNGGAHGIATGDEPRGGGGAYQDDLPSHTSADVEKDTQGDKPVGTEALLAFVPDLLSTFVGSLTSEFLTYPLWVVLNRLIVQGNGCLIVDTISGMCNG
ncbi:hypothetical protein, variant [Sphaeroforma arctica JP610]|uniref:Uncharacterized protein n=1 Tax=Sphaeroforma arctica JP610 TaxID=667725 RepID=A0A0L0G6B3_9EUKA|nr:hypothetical protein, variant [Sphaeroforma arctica JP610]KNC84484.1 hypothetical protein, variant [Sphaeroforma arctica JP610]|eukprot:XP_014158386.1 hypothetical protein, variant [Sphaeroforma arctica JP610]